MRASIAFVLLFAAQAVLAQGAGPVIAAGAPPEVVHPVGPLPGGAQEKHQPNPFAHDPAALMEGRKLFVQMNCAGCHGGHGGGGMGPSLRDPVWLYGDHDDDIFSSIAQGRGKGMPAWGRMLPREAIWKIAAYIKSMRSPEEPQPPE